MLKISTYTILLENGDRISKKKIEKIEKFMSLENLNVLLLSNENIGKTQDDEIRKILSIVDNSNVRNMMMINSVAKKVENQNKIITFLSNYHKNTISRIVTKNTLLVNSLNKFKENEIDLGKNFERYMSSLKLLFSTYKLPQDELNKNIKSIENGYSEFKKFFLIFNDKLDLFNKHFAEFKNKNSKHYESFIQEKTEILSTISKLWNELKNNPKTFNLEKDKLLIYQTTLHNLFTNNSNKIKNLIEEDNVNSKREIIGKMTELELMRKNVETQLNITLIPKIFKNEIKELESEVMIRKEFDGLFYGILAYLNSNLLNKEEMRRKE